MYITLQEMMRAYTRRTKEEMTYKILAEKTHIPRDRIGSIGARENYNASLDDLNLICFVLGMQPNDLLEVNAERAKEYYEEITRKKKKKSKKKKNTKGKPKKK